MSGAAPPLGIALYAFALTGACASGVQPALPRGGADAAPLDAQPHVLPDAEADAHPIPIDAARPDGAPPPDAVPLLDGPTRVVVHFDLPECAPIDCPSAAPFAVGCANIVMTGTAQLGCVATLPGGGTVEFEQRNLCRSDNVAGDVLCAHAPGPPLDPSNCRCRGRAPSI